MSKNLFGEEMAKVAPRPPQYQSGSDKKLKDLWLQNRDMALDKLANLFVSIHFIPKNNEKQLPF